MPTMFSSRRHAPPAQPLTRETANPNAATAAASAFMRRDSNASLSSAAAAAALRARPQTPTNVAEVQTKRAHRRSPSASSQASRDRLPVCERQRSPSVGSMMERTFRSPSPHRSPARRDGHVPPVPSLPSVGDLEPAAAQPLLQTHPFRTASDRMKRGHHGAWFGAAAGGDPANVRRSDAVVASAPEPRPGSVSPSINFSYPRARAQSSPSPADDQTPVYDANSRRMVPRGELLARAQSMYEPTPRQKKRQEPNRSASHLSRGNVATTQTPALQQPQARPAQQQAVADTEMRPAVAPEPPREPDKQTAKKKKKRQQQQQVGGSRSAPSGEPEQGRDAASSTQPSLSKKPNMEAHGNLENSHRPPKPTPSDVTTDSGPKVMAAEAQVSSPEPLRPGSSGRLARESSESPARSARFASAPDQLLVRHEPPPRSVSPKKSAMKLPSQRDASPSDDGSEASEPRRTSEIQDAAAARKRSVRVSWDDRSTVVGEASEPHGAEPPFAPSPQTKKPWHSIVTKYAKKDQVNLSQDETMTPRPALPLFGSVREKKAREVEERPLVRPSERARSSSAAESSATGPPAELGQSSDAAVGAVVAQDQTSRNAANISKYREPPPVALAPGESSAKDSTLVESSSDDDLDIDATTEPDDATEPKLAPGKAPEGQTPESARRAGDEGGTNLDVCGAVPTISVSLPSPGLEEPQQGRDGGDGPKVPGQSPENDNAANGGENPGVKTPAEPTSQGATSSRSAEPPSVVANAAMADIKEEEEEESDRCSVYSDAYEDLEDVDGDGFLSLDAVVEGSAEKKTPILSQEQPAASRLDRVEHSAGSPALSKQGKLSSKQADNWENAKAYWRSLSADQRRLLEMEALSDASDEEEDGPRRAQEGRATTARSEEAPQHSPAVNGRSHQIKSETTWSGDHNSDEQVPAQPSKATPKFRRSMRGEQPGSTARAVDEQHGVLRKSMRTGRPAPAAVSAENTGRGGHHDTDTQATASVAGAGTRATIGNRGCDDDDGGIRPLLSRTGRPASYHPPETTRAHKARKRNLSVEDFRGPGDTGPGLRRQRSDDSVSSFTRSRPSPGTAHGFRKSMRTSKQDWTSPGAAKARGRFSLRSMSPPAFRRNSSTSLPGSPVPSSGGGRMRLSMRSDAKPRTWRSPFKRSPGEKKGGGSRFADSSDDEKAPRPRSRGKGLSRSLRGGADGASGAASVHDATARPQQGSDGAEHAAGLRRSGSGRGTLTPLPARAPGPDGGGDGNDDDDDDDPRPAVDRPRPSTAGGPAGNPRARTMAFHRRNTSLPQQQQHKKKKFGALRKMFGIHN